MFVKYNNMNAFQTRSKHPNPPASSPRAGTHSLRYCGSVTCKLKMQKPAASTTHTQITHSFTQNYHLAEATPSFTYIYFSTFFLCKVNLILHLLETVANIALSRMVIHVPNFFNFVSR